MITSRATWLLPQAGSGLVLLYPDVDTMQQNSELLMVAILGALATSDKVVNLSSDQPTRVSVPASIQILTGQSFGTFVATAGTILGDAVISATIIETVQSTLTVTQALPALRPTAIVARELVPRIVRTEPQ